MRCRGGDEDDEEGREACHPRQSWLSPPSLSSARCSLDASTMPVRCLSRSQAAPASSFLVARKAAPPSSTKQASLAASSNTRINPRRASSTRDCGLQLERFAHVDQPFRLLRPQSSPVALQVGHQKEQVLDGGTDSFATYSSTTKALAGRCDEPAIPRFQGGACKQERGL